MRVSIPLQDIGCTLSLEIAIEELTPLGELRDDETGRTFSFCRECGAVAGDDDGLTHEPGCRSG